MYNNLNAKHKVVSENFNYAIKVCRLLNLTELMELAITMGNEANTEIREIWASAIATVMEWMAPSPAQALRFN